MDSSRTRAGSTDRATEREHGTRTARGPWAVLCAAVTVVLGPAAATASALDQANAAPLRHAARADRPQVDQPRADLPGDSTRGRTAAG
ncbi:hypothetical protein AB0L59_04440 [Streptomyces sp. NPDC052109]|uniref:hypothetical protein n=1 Tax=Streptomyces sp. NPDC052109 TaxID=3155527 RepID=UPI003431C0D3